MISTLNDFKRNCRIDSRRIKQRSNRLYISPPKHSTNSQPELVITDTGNGLMAIYFGGKYGSGKKYNTESTRRAINDCGVDFNSIQFASIGNFTFDSSTRLRGAYNG